MAACSGGLISVSGGEAKVMATTFEWAEDIDLERAHRAKDEAEKKLAQNQCQDMECALVEAKLKRALVRIQVKK